MARGLTILSFVLLCVACYSQNKVKNGQIAACEKCKRDIINYISLNERNLNGGDIDSFLCSLGEECQNDAEFSETGNEMLFYVLIHYPRLSLKSLTENEAIERRFVIDQLSKPVNDVIDLEGALKAVGSVEGYDKIKEEVLNSLQKAKRALNR